MVRRKGLVCPRGSARGQVLVEVLLMLPIFLLLVFTVMEIGHLAFRTILLHHAAYEVARVGSLTSYPVAALPTCTAPSPNSSAMSKVQKSILPRATLRFEKRPPRHGQKDPQDGCMNWDLVVTMTDDVPMIFPMTGMILGNVNRRRGRRLIASVAMPIERPLFGAKSY
ncbi:MAG: TadE/TadG family type IV pilus assembly protein [Elusimicrobiota bacterium]